MTGFLSGRVYAVQICTGIMICPLGYMVAADWGIVAGDEVFHSIVGNGTSAEVGDPGLAKIGLFFAGQSAHDRRGSPESMPMRRKMRIGIEDRDPRGFALPYRSGVAQVFGEKDRAAGRARIRGQVGTALTRL